MNKPAVEMASCRSMEQRGSCFGVVEYVRIYTVSYRRLTWSEVWEAFERIYPGRWAVQMFPPADRLLDEENIYHLFVLPEEFTPAGVDINWTRGRG